MKATGSRLLLLTLGLIGASTAVAWGPQGHRTVGAIADQMLSAQARAVVVQLLAGDLDKFGSPSGRTSLEEVSVWADELHGTPGAHGPWHYDDMPICGREPKERYCRSGQCNTEQLKRLIAVLGDPRAAVRERNEALKWVVHLVGDLHQPLHASDNGDRGGNEVQVALAGVRTRGRISLHKAWDSELVQQAFNLSNRQQPPPNIAALASEAQVLVREAGQGTADSWAVESNNLARNVAYHYAGFACNSRPYSIIVLDREYVDDAQALVRERLLLAGVRLANLLNQTLAAH
jgi:S1/P1 Nuclease